MMRRKHILCLGLGVLLAFAGLTNADEADMQSELAALKTRIAELENTQSQSWMTERKAEEVKGLIREVLADADTRASLLENGMYAGHDGSTFFLKSADGGFLMNIDGQIQVRYAWNSRDNQRDEDNTGKGITSDDNESGFEIPRAKIQFSGHIADPRIRYWLRLAVDKQDNTVIADRILIGYQVTDSVFFWIGEDKAPFLREETTSSSQQLAIDRSYVNEIFTADKVQAVGVNIDAHDQVKVVLAISDGIRSGDGATSVHPFTQTNLTTDDDGTEDDTGAQDEDRSTSKLFNEDASDFAFTARVDVLITGTWDQMTDFSSWSGEELAIFVGAAIHYEEGETGDGFLNNDFFAWTLDGSVEYNGASLFVAYVMHNTDIDDGAPASFKDYDLWGLVVQGAYNIPMGENSVEPFIRWEHLDFDDAVTDAGLNTEDEIDLLTFGANVYLDGHNAKAQVDLVFALDPLPFGASAANLLPDASDEDGQVVLRTQFQLLF